MDSCTYKFYYADGFDSRQYLESYLSDKSEMVFGDNSLKFPIENLAKIFADGHIKGDVLIDLSIGPLAHQLFAACEFFKQIIVLKIRDEWQLKCIMELKRWVEDCAGAFYWGHAAKLQVDLEGKGDKFEDREEKVRSALHYIKKCDLTKENIMNPVVLPPVDCIISAWFLDVISKDHDDYMRYLGKFLKLLKPGGHIILIGDLDTTFLKVGNDKIHVLNYDEDFVRKALVGEGFIIDCCEVKKRTDVSDYSDCKAVIFIAAHKVK
ncbi:nicotinamide N-methyltransferase-like [Dendrobates tinctorius]|uniref:nicotinamide N-methyltransferase-like n=1 Tax=Dendrobates tinctorius TaxID=92724 RepID=UPI003CC9BA29